MIPSLPEVNRSIAVAEAGPWLTRLAGFLGPGCLVAVGYMDPGNWATDLAGGAQFGNALLWVVALSSLIGMLLQVLSVRLGVATGRDLAQHCRARLSAPMARLYWMGCELAIGATDLAEVIGTAIGIKLLFGIPLTIGVVLTGLDVLLILWLQQRSFRYLEALVAGLVLLVGVCFVLNLLAARPQWSTLAAGLIPHRQVLTDRHMAYLAIGILGATVMPHNLYLHSSIVQTRRFRPERGAREAAAQFASVDTVAALLLAFLANGALLMLAAAALHGHGLTAGVGIEQAQRLLAPLLGAGAAVLFGVALIASGQASALSATLAGQVVMEAMTDMRMKPWARRLCTRALALLPALVVAFSFGESGIARLLVLSQVLLSLQLPFAMIPLVRITADARQMGSLVSPLWLRALAWLSVAVILLLNGVLIVRSL